MSDALENSIDLEEQLTRANEVLNKTLEELDKVKAELNQVKQDAQEYVNRLNVYRSALILLAKEI